MLVGTIRMSNIDGSETVTSSDTYTQYIAGTKIKAILVTNSRKSEIATKRLNDKMSPNC